MNKDEMFRILKEENLPKEEYYILSGGCLLLYGLRENTSDLDLCVSKEAFNILREKYSIDETCKNKSGFYKINEFFEVVIGNKYRWEVGYKEGYQVEKLEDMLRFKEKRNAEKDKKDILKIKEYLEKNGK